MKRRRKRSRHAPKEPMEERGPTPQTVAHAQALGPDPIENLVHEGLIDAAGERACEEIRRIWEALTYELQPNLNSFSARAKGIREMPDDVAEAYSERYKPWVEDTKPRCWWVTAIVVTRAMPRREITGDIIPRS